jgi:hypothetical protein
MNMKTNHQDQESENVCLAYCRKMLAQMEQAKNAILAEFQGLLQAPEHLLRLALNEAEALAWKTDYPQLVFPALAMEKANDVTAWHVRQEAILHPNQLAVAA